MITVAVVAVLIVMQSRAIVCEAMINLADIQALRCIMRNDTTMFTKATRNLTRVTRWSASPVRDDLLVYAALRTTSACGELGREQFPTTRSWQAFQGRCLWMSGRRSEAAQIWRRAGVSEHLILLAAFDKAHDRMTDAVAEYEEALAADPSSVRAQLALGDLYERTKSWDLAERVYEQALRIDPTDPRPYQAMAIYRSHRGVDDEKTEEIYEAAIRIAENDPLRRGDNDLPWTYTNLALRYLQTGRSRLAEDTARKATTSAPKIAYPHFVLGESLRQNGKPRDAIVELQRARELGSNGDDVRFSLALAYLEAGDVRDARREADRLRRKNPSSPTFVALMQRIESADSVH